jgi:hypothetical protein
MTLNRWIRVTTLGWLVGIPLVVAFALLAEGLGIGGMQSMVGLGIGSGVGVMQARALVSWLPRRRHWIMVTAIGIGLPFLAADVLLHAGADIEYSLTWCVVGGGLLAGIGQAVLLRPHVDYSWRWIPVSTAGWAAAAGMATIADGLREAGARGIAGALAYLGLIALGGVVLGVVTGAAWRFLPPKS